jgi:purine-nucleoside phosphorylase
MNYQAAADVIQARTALRPQVALTLGSGLGAFAEQLSDRTEIPYGEIPGWPVSTAIGHAGRLMVGRLGELPLAVMAGRAHLYEGYSPQQVVFGVRALHRAGVRKFVFTNAAGGINLSYGMGSLVLITDHINLQGTNPLCGANDPELGARFPDMSEAYALEFREQARQCAKELGLDLREGVYAGLLGPSYETPAEIRYLRAIGADLVGMSTVGEVIAANHLGARCLGISCVTNMAAGVLPQKLDHAEVLEVGRRVAASFTALLRAVLPRL